MHIKNTGISKKFHDYFRNFLKQVNKPVRKNFLEFSKGIVLANSVVISEVVRATNNRSIVRKRVERIGNMLDKINSEELNEYMITTKHASKIHEKTIIAIDNSDTIKEYANCIEGMSKIHDGSTGENRNGFEIFGSSYIDDEGRSHMLQFELYSRETDDYKSEYMEWENNMNNLLKIIHPDAGIFVMDCGYDGEKYYNYLLKNGKDFVIRMNERRIHPRKIYFDDFKEKWDIDALPYSREKKTQIEIRNKKTNRFELVTVKLSTAKIRLTKDGEFLNLLRIKRIKKHSKMREMYLLTTLKVSGINQMISVYASYLKRWKIEELFRSIKQHFQIEKVQLRKLKRIQALYRLIMIMHNFLNNLSELSESLKNSIFYHARELQKKTQNMSLFTAVFYLAQQEWGYWKHHIHDMFFRTPKVPQKQLQLNFNTDYLINIL